MILSSRLVAPLFLWFATVQLGQAQDEFQCGDPVQAVPLVGEFITDFDIIAPYLSYRCETNWYNGVFDDDTSPTGGPIVSGGRNEPAMVSFFEGPYGPRNINWHIHYLPEEELEEIKISMFPQDIVVPYVENYYLQFKFNEDLYDFQQNTTVKSGVNLYIPMGSDLRPRLIELESFGQSIEIINESRIAVHIVDRGISNNVAVHSPNAMVSYTLSGVNNTAAIEAGPGTYIETNGAEGNIQVKTSEGDESLRARLSGNNPTFVIDGSYKEIAMEGADVNVMVIGGDDPLPSCVSIFDRSGRRNECQVVTNTTFAWDEFECLAESVVERLHCGDYGGIVGSGIETATSVTVIGLGLILVIVCCVCCCTIGGVIACVCCYQKQNRDRGPTTKQQPIKAATLTTSSPPTPTANLNAIEERAAAVDLEQAAPASSQTSEDNSEPGYPMVPATPLPSNSAADTPVVNAVVIDK